MAGFGGLNTPYSGLSILPCLVSDPRCKGWVESFSPFGSVGIRTKVSVKVSVMRYKKKRQE